MFNYKQLVVDQLEFKSTVPVPYGRLSFADGISNKIDQYYGSNRWKNNLHNAIVSFSGIKESDNHEDIFKDDYGVTWRYGMGAKHIEIPALEKPSLNGYKFPSVEELCPDRILEETEAKIASSKEYFSLVTFSFGLFERTWTLRGFENTLMDIAAEPAFYEDLIEAVTEHQLQMIERLIQTSADGIYFSDDWCEQRGVIIGAARWRELVKPRVARLYDKVHAAGKYVISHCCGNVSEIIGDCVEIGLNCLQSVQPEAMNPYELKKLFSGQMAFWGGLGSQRTVPFGTPNEIKKEVKKLRSEMAKDGGYILGPAKMILDDTPLENAIAVLESFNEEYNYKTL